MGVTVLGVQHRVALRKESVDRNLYYGDDLTFADGVALRKESVDRNKYVVQCRKVMGVALRKESVDRNRTGLVTGCEYLRSLSARRAWIEMVLSGRRIIPGIVALRKESVDRNVYQLLAIGKYAVALRKESVDRNLAPVMYLPTSPGESLSARRAWIEMT